MDIKPVTAFATTPVGAAQPEGHQATKLFETYWQYRNGEPSTSLFATHDASLATYASAKEALIAAAHISKGAKPAVAVVQGDGGFFVKNLSDSNVLHTYVTLAAIKESLGPDHVLADSSMPGGLVALVDGASSAHLSLEPTPTDDPLVHKPFQGHLVDGTG